MGNKKNSESNETEYVEMDADELYEILDRLRGVVESFEGDVSSRYDEWVRRGCFDRALELHEDVTHDDAPLNVDDVIATATKIYDFVRRGSDPVRAEQERPERFNLTGDAAFARTTP